MFSGMSWGASCSIRPCSANYVVQMFWTCIGEVTLLVIQCLNFIFTLIPSNTESVGINWSVLSLLHFGFTAFLKEDVCHWYSMLSFNKILSVLTEMPQNFLHMTSISLYILVLM